MMIAVVDNVKNSLLFQVLIYGIAIVLFLILVIKVFKDVFAISNNGYSKKYDKFYNHTSHVTSDWHNDAPVKILPLEQLKFLYNKGIIKLKYTRKYDCCGYDFRSYETDDICGFYIQVDKNTKPCLDLHKIYVCPDREHIIEFIEFINKSKDEMKDDIVSEQIEAIVKERLSDSDYLLYNKTDIDA